MVSTIFVCFRNLTFLKGSRKEEEDVVTLNEQHYKIIIFSAHDQWFLEFPSTTLTWPLFIMKKSHDKRESKKMWIIEYNISVLQDIINWTMFLNIRFIYLYMETCLLIEWLPNCRTWRALFFQAIKNFVKKFETW